jgi:hypothetical protein
MLKPERPDRAGDYNADQSSRKMTNSSSLKQNKSTCRLPHSGQRGQVLVFLIIVIAVIAGGLFFLISMRKDAKAEGERFVRQVIERCAFQHDVKFLHASVASDRRLAVPPAMDDQFIYFLTKLGVPDRNYNLTGQLDFDHYFGSPHGTYQAILTYPDQHATVSLTIARPSGIWLVTDFGVTYERPPG